MRALGGCLRAGVYWLFGDSEAGEAPGGGEGEGAGGADGLDAVGGGEDGFGDAAAGPVGEVRGAFEVEGEVGGGEAAGEVYGDGLAGVSGCG